MMVRTIHSMLRAVLIFVSLFFIPSIVWAKDRCIDAPVLLYHHVVEAKIGKAKGYGSLFVDPKLFRLQMEELRALGYEVRPLKDLSAYFDTGAELPKKPAFITFDDGNRNIAEVAWPILQEFGYPSTMFVVPRQMTHRLYVSIEEASQLNDQHMVIANHGYSHASFGKLGLRKTREEILRAESILASHGFNAFKVFAYPYGVYTERAQQTLKDVDYRLAFLASGGTRLCSADRMMLPRIPISNSSLVKQGFR